MGEKVRDTGQVTTLNTLLLYSPGVNSRWIQALKFRLMSQWKSPSLPYLIEGSSEIISQNNFLLKRLERNSNCILLSIIRDKNVELLNN